MEQAALATSPDLKVATAAFPPKLRLNPNALMLQGQVRRVFGPVKAPPGATQDDVRSPHFLALVAHKLVRHDLISVLADDESWELELCVEKVGRTEVFTSTRKVYARTGIQQAHTIVDGIGEFHSEWRAGAGWCIIRRSDGFPVVKGHNIEANAIAQWRREQPKPVI